MREESVSSPKRSRFEALTREHPAASIVRLTLDAPVETPATAGPTKALAASPQRTALSARFAQPFLFRFDGGL